MNIGLQGVSSMKLPIDLGISQPSAWHMAHRIAVRRGESEGDLFSGPTEVVETFIGGKERNNAARTRSSGRGVRLGLEDGGCRGQSQRDGTDRRPTDSHHRQGGPTRVRLGVHCHRLRGLYRRGSKPTRGCLTAPTGLANAARMVSTRSGQAISRQAAYESVWAVMKRRLSWHLSPCLSKVPWPRRYAHEFSGRHNTRPLDTQDQLGKMRQRAVVGKRLTYAQLAGPKDIRHLAGCRAYQPALAAGD